MAIDWVLGVRGLQAVVALTVLGLMGYVATWWSTHWRQFSPHEVNFMIFTPVWSLLAVAPLVIIPWKMPNVAEKTVPKIGLIVVEALTTLYWFAGFIALAVFLSDRICFGTVCSVAKAGTAISAFSWVAWAVTLVMSSLRAFRGSSRSSSPSNNNEPKVEMHQGV